MGIVALREVMKRHLRSIVAIPLALLLVVAVPFSSVRADDPNLIANPSFETGTTSTSNWYQGGWGTRTANFTYSTDAHTGGKSA